MEDAVVSRRRRTRPDTGGFAFFTDRIPEIGKGVLVMLEHLNPEEIAKMPLHMQILYYFGKWGKLVQDEEILKKAG